MSDFTIDGLAEDTDPQGDDFVMTKDTSAGTYKKVQLDNMDRRAYGQLTGSTFSGATPGAETKLAIFDAEQASSGVTLSHANDEITIVRKGIYRILFAVSGDSSGTGEFYFGIAKDGTIIAPYQIVLQWGASEYQNGTIEAFVPLLAGDIISVRGADIGASFTLSTTYASLSVELREPQV